MQKKIHINEVCQIMELPVTVWDIPTSTSYEQAQAKLQKFKVLIKKQRNILAKKYHPDKTGKDDDTKIKEINATVDLVMGLKINKAPRPQIRIIQNPFQGFASSSTSTSSSTTGTGGATFHYFRFR